jgi:hypothetical protein
MKKKPGKDENKTGNCTSVKGAGSKEIDAYIKGFHADVGVRL